MSLELLERNENGHAILDGYIPTQETIDRAAEAIHGRLGSYIPGQSTTSAALAALARRVLGQVATQTGAFTAADTGNYLVTGSTSFTVAAPSSPTVGDVFQIKLDPAYSGTVTLTGTFDSVSGLTMNTPGMAYIFTWSGTYWEIS